MTMIGIDWGTTSFRAFLIGSDGSVVAKRSSSDGILSVKNNEFEATLMQNINDWISDNPNAPIIASGMITSRNGWLETEYVSLPATLDDLATATVPYELSSGKKIHFVTGACFINEDEVPDIMRGEETQIIGASKSDECVFLLPGTHSKWALVKDQTIESFSSFMTGEVYASLKANTILGTLMEVGESQQAFLRGVRARKEQDTSILHQIFSARTLPLFEKMENTEIADYLSGLLIGDEIKAALKNYKVNKDVQIIGRGDLASRYASALEIFGIGCHLINDEITASGHYKIAIAAGLLK